jgi:hypothetical protein
MVERGIELVAAAAERATGVWPGESGFAAGAAAGAIVANATTTTALTKVERLTLVTNT